MESDHLAIEDVPSIIITGLKGGTGKTVIATNLAGALSENFDYAVGVLDADLDSPNLPEVMGVDGVMGLDSDQNFVLVEPTPSLRIFSMRLFANEAANHGFSKQGDQADQIISDALKYSNWGDIGLLVVDLPAGSSDEFRAVIKRLRNILGIVIVTLPNTVTDLKRVIDLSGRFRLPIIGVVENMVRAVCPSCQEAFPLFGSNNRIKDVCTQHKVNYLGSIPYLPQLHQEGSYRLPPEANGILKRIIEEAISS